MDKGLLVAIEGPDGTGKSTVASLVAAALAAAGVPAWPTCEPTVSGLGTVVRGVAPALSWRAAALCFAADRAAHVEVVIAPALARGEVVVCDRYALSGLVYSLARAAPPDPPACAGTARWCEVGQVSYPACCLDCPGVTQGLDGPHTWLLGLEESVPAPALTVVLDAPPEVAAARLAGRGAGEAYDRDAGLQRRVRALYAHADRVVPGWRLRRVDAARDPNEVAADVVAAVREVSNG